MQNADPNLLTRPDTFFGVCEGLGEDFRIHPNILRVLMAGLMFWNPAAAIGSYAAAGLLVGLSRWLAPNPAPALALAAGEAQADHDPLLAKDEPEAVPLAA